MQFQVPQFIETEDKIVGPFTMRQFIYIALGAGISFLIFFMTQLTTWIFLAIIVMGIFGTLAFLRVNGQSITRVILSAFFFYWKPQTYVWQPDVPHQEREDVARESGLTLEHLVASVSLKNSWQELQTGTKLAPDRRISLHQLEERYEIIHRFTGDQRAARRVDYR